MKASDLKPGNALKLDGQLYTVVKVDHVKPGKGGAFAQSKLKSLMTGSNTEKRFRSNEEVEQVDLDRREVEYLYSDASGAVFMDQETFEQFNIPGDVLGDAMQYIKPNTPVSGLFHEGNPLAVDLPAAVDLAVTDTPPGIKNATATNQLKEATLETGLKTRVPPFISNGEVVRISTEDGSYISRVTDAG